MTAHSNASNAKAASNTADATDAHDPLARAIAQVVTSITPPATGIDLHRVRQRGRRRRLARRAAVATPLTLAALALVGALWQPWVTPHVTPSDGHRHGNVMLTPQPGPSTTPEPTRSSATTKATTAATEGMNPQETTSTVLAAVFLDIDPDLPSRTVVDQYQVEGIAGPSIAWFAQREDRRSEPATEIKVTIGDARAQAAGLLPCRTGNTDCHQIAEEQLPSGARLVTTRTDLTLMHDDSTRGTASGQRTDMVVTYPNGRVVAATAFLDADAATVLPPDGALDSPTFTDEKVRALVTDPRLAIVPLPDEGASVPDL